MTCGNHHPQHARDDLQRLAMMWRLPRHRSSPRIDEAWPSDGSSWWREGSSTPSSPGAGSPRSASPTPVSRRAMDAKLIEIINEVLELIKDDEDLFQNQSQRD
eukprot:CAMPEP_0176093544 /NCGR_PEP_ID=MMETSP0120_2-20121206/46875_1 /TAXON_ID=160619 /ORGANISM="Kryptoperidinium foliaceum, Strain CCMP 1326" /LENGTH=102 /DNA_ID=CAMNT_0017427483 /DNA_START=309 /DNA_END=617 /DNA_ORIENTATION=-